MLFQIDYLLVKIVRSWCLQCSSSIFNWLIRLHERLIKHYQANQNCMPETLVHAVFMATANWGPSIKYSRSKGEGVREGVTVCHRREGSRACDVTLKKFHT